MNTGKPALTYSCTASAVLPSALDCLTAVFEMGTGVASPVKALVYLYSFFGAWACGRPVYPKPTVFAVEAIRSKHRNIHFLRKQFILGKFHRDTAILNF